MAALVCPICGAPFDADRSPAMPFCSPRCRNIDLGRWLDEKYTVPALSAATDEADASPPSPNATEQSEKGDITD